MNITDDQIRHVAARHFRSDDGHLHAVAERALGDSMAVPNHDRDDGPPTVGQCRESMAFYRAQFADTCAHCRGPSDLAAVRSLVAIVKSSYAWRGRPAGDSDQRTMPRIIRRRDGRQFVISSADPAAAAGES